MVQDFVNTADRMRDHDGLQTADGAARVLAGLGLMDDGQLDEGDRRRVVAFREALRQLLLSHHADERDVASAVDDLNTVIGSTAMRPHFSPQGQLGMHAPGGPSAHQVIAAVLAAIDAADDEGGWRRLKVCQNPACRWAFHDASRNRSGRWCDMNVCGARHKMRTYRERRR